MANFPNGYPQFLDMFPITTNGIHTVLKALSSSDVTSIIAILVWVDNILEVK